MRVRHSLKRSCDLTSRFLASSSNCRLLAAAAVADIPLPRGTISDAASFPPCSSRENPDVPLTADDTARSTSSSTTMSSARMSCADVAPSGLADAGLTSDIDKELSLCDILSRECRRHSGRSDRTLDVASTASLSKIAGGAGEPLD